jgi:Ala-tRNA(Pro) deacylase
MDSAVLSAQGGMPMTIARTVVASLQRQRIPYEIVAHPHSESSRESARLAQIPADQLAKAVLLADRRGCVLAVIPGNCRLDLEALSRIAGRQLGLAREARLGPVFPDCDPGAIPPLGPDYGIETFLDDGLAGREEVYFEAGDHEQLIRLRGGPFLALLKGARHGRFSH